MVTATPIEDLRVRFRWHRGYRPEADERPEEYEPRLTPWRVSLMLGTLTDAHGDAISTLWVQRPLLYQRPVDLRQDSTGRPVFAVLLRKGPWWHQLGLFPSVPAALEALAAALPKSGAG